MRFLIKTAFWLTIVAIFLPTPEQPPKSAAPVSAVEAVSAAGAAIGDMRQFCARQPDACDVGSQAAVALGHKAQAGAKMLYDYLNDKAGETGSIGGKPPEGSGTGRHSQHTLTPADLAPAWRGPGARAPEPRPDPRRAS
jgi:Family of unknown function (DUF5330)